VTFPLFVIAGLDPLLSGLNAFTPVVMVALVATIHVFYCFSMLYQKNQKHVDTRIRGHDDGVWIAVRNICGRPNA
jgi:hypothetical protein